MMITLGELTEFRVAFNGNRGSIMLMFGDRKKRRQRRKKPCAPGAEEGVGCGEAKTGGSFCDAAPSPDKSARSGTGGYQTRPLNHRGIAARATFLSLAASPEGDGQSQHRAGG